MSDAKDELNISELDDGYLKILLLLSVRRASSSDPRRAGFWHGLAGILSSELETRQATSGIGMPTEAAAGSDTQAASGTDAALGMTTEVGEVLDELRRDVATLEAEYRSSLS
ncbi:MAG TPA: hypothetical protein VG184_11755 [Acidimicrobiales bacterium]|jgi:hypothetical protein|nr:hypothetical protein [Acidimicrobiales bacterium]